MQPWRLPAVASSESVAKRISGSERFASGFPSVPLANATLLLLNFL